MTEKRFKAIDENIWQGNEIWCVAGGKHCADVIATAMNELINENEQLKQLCKVLIKEIEKKSIAFLIDDDIRRMLELE